MPAYTTAFPSKYLKAEDLGNRRLTATIADVSFADIGTGANAGRKLVARFSESGIKSLVLNRINCNSIAELAGSDDYDTWPGTRIELYATRTEFQGKRVACIRIAAPARLAPAPASAVVDEELGI